jgi:hypothetical protein
MAIAALGS